MATIRIKISIVGDQCGKTSLQTVFVKDIFPDTAYISRGEMEANSCIKVDDKKVELNIWDTPSQELYGRLRTGFAYPKTDVILLCFSFDKPRSLERISEQWIPEVKQYLPKAPIILVGNKKDLKDLPYDESTLIQKPVKTEEAQTVAEKIGAFSYLECSAKCNEGVRAVFESVARAGVLRDEKKKSKCKLL